jgi:hypothetical protein
VDKAKRGIKRSVAVEADGIPLGIICVPANRHDPPLLGESLESMDDSIELVEQASSVHLDHAYDSNVTRELLEDRGLVGVISKKGKPAPLQATKRLLCVKLQPRSLRL